MRVGCGTIVVRMISTWPRRACCVPDTTILRRSPVGTSTLMGAYKETDPHQTAKADTRKRSSSLERNSFGFGFSFSTKHSSPVGSNVSSF